jgi:hypothetical protein
MPTRPVVALIAIILVLVSCTSRSTETSSPSGGASEPPGASAPGASAPVTEPVEPSQAPASGEPSEPAPSGEPSPSAGESPSENPSESPSGSPTARDAFRVARAARRPPTNDLDPSTYTNKYPASANNFYAVYRLRAGQEGRVRVSLRHKTKVLGSHTNRLEGGRWGWSQFSTAGLQHGAYEFVFQFLKNGDRRVVKFTFGSDG